MAKYNYWEAAGKPTSYNPLPTGWGAKIDLTPSVEYVMLFKAKSLTGAKLQVQSSGKVYGDPTLTSEFKEYEIPFQVSSYASPGAYFYDVGSAGNIVITDIRAVEKPFGRATINGLDGFRSGKWNVHANAKIIDDETLELNAGTGTQATFLDVYDIEIGETYTAYIQDNSSGYVYFEQRSESNAILQSSYGTVKSKEITVLPTTKRIVVGMYNAGVAGFYTFKKPMLVKGKIQVPYEKKRGQRMVTPQVVGNIVRTTRKATKPLRQATKYPLGKNIFNGKSVSGYLSASNVNETPLAATVGQRTTEWQFCKGSQMYTFSGNDRQICHFKNASGVITGFSGGDTVTTPADAVLMRVYYSTNGTHDKFQIEEGPTKTPYEPYRGEVRRAPKGLEFNGTSDRLQVSTPLGTLGNKDFEIETIFVFNPSNPGGYSQQSIVSCGDIRFGVSSVANRQIGFYTPVTGWVNTVADIDNKIVKLKAVIKPSKVQIYVNGELKAEKEYTGAINATVQTILHIAAYGGSQYFFSGALRTLKLISEGATVLDYDFTKPQNNIGTKIKGSNGLDATVYGSPVQLNRQARR